MRARPEFSADQNSGQRQAPPCAAGTTFSDGVLAALPKEDYPTASSRRGRSLEQRLRYAFVRTRKPVLDDARFRAFDTMEDYRRWCEENLPAWLSYGR